jgi:hypothetical protein
MKNKLHYKGFIVQKKFIFYFEDYRNCPRPHLETIFYQSKDLQWG